jgi:hypothetical protein
LSGQNYSSPDRSANMRPKPVFRRFVYELVYPAILGSMLYEAFHQGVFGGVFAFPWEEHNKNAPTIPTAAAQLMVVLIYVLAWFYVVHPGHARVRDHDAHPWAVRLIPVIDLMSAIAFLAAFVYAHPARAPVATMLWCLCGVAGAYTLLQAAFLQLLAAAAAALAAGCLASAANSATGHASPERFRLVTLLLVVAIFVLVDLWIYRNAWVPSRAPACGTCKSRLYLHWDTGAGHWVCDYRAHGEIAVETSRIPARPPWEVRLRERLPSWITRWF